MEVACVKMYCGKKKSNSKDTFFRICWLEKSDGSRFIGGGAGTGTIQDWKILVCGGGKRMYLQKISAKAPFLNILLMSAGEKHFPSRIGRLIPDTAK